MGHRIEKTLTSRVDVTLGGQLYRAARNHVPADLIIVSAAEAEALFAKSPYYELAGGGAADVGEVRNGTVTHFAYKPWRTVEPVEGQSAGKHDDCLLKIRANKQISIVPGLNASEMHALWNAEAFYLPYWCVRGFSAFCLESDYGVTVFAASLLILDQT